MKRVILLDLNFTLVANSSQRWPVIRRRGMGVWIEMERYRGWLIDLLRGERVLMLTARPERWREATLARIGELHRWEPDAAMFKDRDLQPPELKRAMLHEQVFPMLGREPGQYLALESNARTRAMYQELGIQAVRVPEEGWSELP